jgi:hypothetical protein
MKLGRDGYSVEVALSRGQPLPDWYLDEPELCESGAFLLRAFDKLTTCRETGFGVGPIPWTAVDRYAERMGLDPEMTNVLEDVILALDRTYLAERERNKPKMAKFGDRG